MSEQQKSIIAECMDNPTTTRDGAAFDWMHTTWKHTAGFNRGDDHHVKMSGEAVGRSSFEAPTSSNKLELSKAALDVIFPRSIDDMMEEALACELAEAIREEVDTEAIQALTVGASDVTAYSGDGFTISTDSMLADMATNFHTDSLTTQAVSTSDLVCGNLSIGITGLSYNNNFDQSSSVHLDDQGIRVGELWNACNTRISSMGVETHTLIVNGINVTMDLLDISTKHAEVDNLNAELNTMRTEMSILQDQINHLMTKVSQ